MDACRTLLASGLEQLPMALAESQIESLLAYVELLAKWNKTYNLTSIRRPEAIIGVHLLDSLAVRPHLTGDRIVDVGTGAGLPGIPLAIAEPDKQFVLIDGNAKKTRFVQQAVWALKLGNVDVVTARVENYRPEQGFDAAIARAVASLSELVRSCAHLLNPCGVLLAMKGQLPTTELAELHCAAEPIKLTVPGVDAERCLIKIHCKQS